MVKKQKRWYHEPTVIVALITVVGGGIFTLILKKGVDDPASTPTSVQPIVQTTVTVNNSNTSTNEIKEEKAKDVDRVQKKNSYFSTSGTTLTENLLNTISKKINKKYSKFEAQYIIEFDHSGEIVPVKFSTTLYKYNGGHLRINVNGIACTMNNKYYLSPTLSAGNPKESVEQLIDSMKQKLILREIEIISNDIKSCIN